MTLKSDLSADSGISPPATNESWFNMRQWWIPTSVKALEEAEKSLLRGVKNYLLGRFTPVLQGQANIWSIVCGPSNVTNESGDVLTSTSRAVQGRQPLVLLHGFGSGVGLWLTNLDALSTHRVVHACDLLGFGRSSRIKFSRDADLAEREWVQSLEDWRVAMKLEKFILLGHSLGGYLAGAYALAHPSRVRHLILVDPWGVPKEPSESLDQMMNIPPLTRALWSIVTRFSLFAGLRAVGRFGGPSMIKRLRSDLGLKFEEFANGDAVYDYLYHCNAQKPSGEIAFKTLWSAHYPWAKRPLIERLPKLPVDLPITFIYGAQSWIGSGSAYELEFNLRTQSFVNVQVIEGAGHHVYVDNVAEFNTLVNDVCARADANLDSPQHKGRSTQFVSTRRYLGF